tara:strand:+ start:74 stop:826 length:753 start_codon:yes stop_codon:yes gene_type:complete
MEKNVWLYFNTQADDDSIGVSTNACYNAKNLVAMFPTSDTELTLHFQNMVNFGTKEPDSVALTLATANTHNAVITKLVQNINNTRPNFNGFITVGDDLTTIVGGAAGSAETEYLMPEISAVGTISIRQGDVGTEDTTAITATADGATEGKIRQGGFYRVASGNNDHIVTLPAAIPGTVVYLNSVAETSEAYELRSSDPSTISINGGTGSNAESAIATGIALVRCICISSTAWIATQFANDGTESKVEAAA